jgi:phosphoglycerate dehydrogenase-like enzyme
VRRAVVDLASPRPAWCIPEQSVAAIRRALGRGWHVVTVRTPAVSDGDGAVGSPEAEDAAQGTELYFGWGVPPDVARAAAGSLRWAHTGAAGVRASLTPALLDAGVLLTNSRGVNAEPMADWALAAIAFCVRGFHAAAAAQREGRWARDAFTGGAVPLRELADTRVGIIGLGGVGRAVARRCAAVGMEVRGVRRCPSRRRPAGVQWVGGPRDVVRLARWSHVLVIAAPQTAATRQLVDSQVLDALPPDSFIVNLARGALLDEEALLAHLERGQLAGCVLDVFQAEPLPAGHPFWNHPRVLLTPHVSAVSQRFWERETALIVENIGRYLAGRRLRNLVDPEVGY